MVTELFVDEREIFAQGIIKKNENNLFPVTESQIMLNYVEISDAAGNRLIGLKQYT